MHDGIDKEGGGGDNRFFCDRLSRKRGKHLTVIFIICAFVRHKHSQKQMREKNGNKWKKIRCTTFAASILEIQSNQTMKVLKLIKANREKKNVHTERMNDGAKRSGD